MDRIAEVTLFSGIGNTKNGYKYDEKAIERAINSLKKNTAMTNERKVLVSRIRTPDGTVLESRYTHDFVQHTDANGELYFLDGGPDYKRTSVNTIPAEDVSVYTDSPFHEIRTHLKRGTFDKDGNRIWKPLKDLSNKHLENILEYNRKLGGDNSTFSEMVRREIEYRRRHGITIEDDWKEYGKRPVKAD